MDLFLYDNDLRHEIVKTINEVNSQTNFECNFYICLLIAGHKKSQVQ